ncbi:MAG: indolepyruvate oxidoreductase subunit beta [Syntrophales bacterium]|jgi:indolepyruvate ferredoxin oxidoreductase beta subunit|nr:indolepyruvate oxidoreductase subunit beta [Syntrophales bacterium]MDD4338939.1 indolepyruvate oxidoreductase subunit beta [Syntrophales bacterium]HOG08219.1 indolepyruvate oxidoreductase subunit beta [Syntrophales bacterium]HOS77108.1 indolepyruvate oxidoreductase subunit beta [Syntrophales bacterium]HPB69535.1 indolepyruvate oxidoreductase subunit beta [Syntrophales bacterium]
MGTQTLPNDPFNIIITGVGGQGNVLASRVLANMLVRRGYDVTIGETFGASQRGGSVMSHIRVSTRGAWSPQIPKGKADMVVSLEPVEAIRVMKDYGNEEVRILVNDRPIYPVGVIAGELNYPALDEIAGALKDLSKHVWFIDATEEAIRLGNPILGNVIMIGAACGLGILPVGRAEFAEVMKESLAADKLEINLAAFDLGAAKPAAAA